LRFAARGARFGVSISGVATGEEEIASDFFEHLGQLDHVGLRLETLGPLGQRRAVGAVVTAVTRSRACVQTPIVGGSPSHRPGRAALGVGRPPLPSRAFESVRGSFEGRYNIRLHQTVPRERCL